MAATAEFDPERSAMAAIQMGDQQAFRQFLRRQDRWVRGVVFAVLGDGDRVDDVVQQVWTAVWQRSTELRDVDRWRPWLYRLARNAALDAGREATRRRKLNQQAQQQLREAEWPTGPDDDAVEEERMQVVREAIEALPPMYRESFTLRHLEGWSYRQIAEVLDVPVGTVETRLVRARRRLREALSGKV